MVSDWVYTVYFNTTVIVVYFRQKQKKNVLMTKTPGSAPTVSHVMKTTNQGSAPAAVTSSKVTSLNSSKQTPLVTDSAKSVLHINAQNTPVVTAKKIVPTILDYTNKTVERNGANVLPNSANASGIVVSGENIVKTVSPGTTSLIGKMFDSKPPQSKPMAESWNHPVADILRQSVTNQKTNKPATPTVSQYQRQSSFENSFLAWAGFQHGANQSSPPKEQSHGQLSIHVNQQQKPGQQKTGIDLSPPKGHGQGHSPSAMQEKFLMESQERQIKRLLLEQEKKKQAAQQLVKIGNQAKNSSRNPDTSPNSMNLVKNVNSSGHNFGAGGDVVSRPLPSKHMQINKNVSFLTENVIRQQLDKHASSVPSSMSKGAGQAWSVADVNSSPASVADQLRKTSPKTASLSPAVSIPQGIPQVIRMTQVQGNSSPLPSSDTTVAASLLQSLFVQAQSRTNQSKSYTRVSQANSNQSVPHAVASTHNAQNQSRSPLQPSNSSAQGTTPKWSPTSLAVSGYHGLDDLSMGQRRLSLEGSGDGSSKQYMVSANSPHTVAGYQNVNLSKLSSEQMAAYQHSAGELLLVMYCLYHIFR